MKMMVDPPFGWRYGFPKPFDPGVDSYEQMLREAGYPEKDILFALKNSRYFGVEDGSTETIINS